MASEITVKTKLALEYFLYVKYWFEKLLMPMMWGVNNNSTTEKYLFVSSKTLVLSRIIKVTQIIIEIKPIKVIPLPIF